MHQSDSFLRIFLNVKIYKEEVLCSVKDLHLETLDRLERNAATLLLLSHNCCVWTKAN